jgi:hypothetical protein
MNNVKACLKLVEAWWALVCLSAAVIVTACGPAQAAPMTTTSGSQGSAEVLPSPCSAIAQLDHLVVHRVDAFPGNGFRFSFPAVVTVVEVASVQDAARALCALPSMPAGPMSCPADFGITYRLTFSAAGRPFPTVTVSATGCEAVVGLVPTRWAARSPAFWRELGKAMGLPKPTWATFTGSRGASG